MRIFFGIIAVIVITSAATQAQAAPVRYEFEGSFYWKDLPRFWAPTDSGTITFAGWADLEPNRTIFSPGGAGLTDFDDLRIGDVTFNDSNVGVVIYTHDIASFRFTLGGVNLGASVVGSRTDDFDVMFRSTAVDVHNLRDSFTVGITSPLYIRVSNKRRYNIPNPGKAGGSMTFTRVQPAVVPVPAAAPLFLAGLAAVGFVNRRRKKPAA